MFLCFVLGLFLWFFTAQAALVNVTIDDTTGDPLTGASVIYTPSDAWNSGPAACHKCLVHPDSKELVDGTWHDSTFSASGTDNTHANVPLFASVSFNGSAVYVFCALSRSSTNPDGDSDMTFYIDGVPVGAFNQRAIASAGYEYGVPVYANTTLTPGPHNVTLQNGHENGYQSLMILDSIVYSYDNGLPPPSHVDSSAAATSSAPASGTSRGTTLAVVGVLVSALVLILLALGIFLYRRRRRRREIYARYMPNGSISAFPVSLTPSGTPAPSFIAAPSPVYGGGSRFRSNGGGDSGNWSGWAGLGQKGSSSSAGLRGVPTHRPYEDLDPAQASFQRPQRWEHVAPLH